MIQYSNSILLLNMKTIYHSIPLNTYFFNFQKKTSITTPNKKNYNPDTIFIESA